MTLKERIDADLIWFYPRWSALVRFAANTGVRPRPCL